jgi:hypothetical protein
MEDPNPSNDEIDVDVSPNPISLLQRHHTKPIESHTIYLNPEAQPETPAAARGENPYTGISSSTVSFVVLSHQSA